MCHFDNPALRNNISMLQTLLHDKQCQVTCLPDPGRITAYAEADPEADKQNVIFTQAGFFQSIMLPKNALIMREKKEEEKTAVNTILLFLLAYMPSICLHALLLL